MAREAETWPARHRPCGRVVGARDEWEAGRVRLTGSAEVDRLERASRSRGGQIGQIDDEGLAGHRAGPDGASASGAEGGVAVEDRQSEHLGLATEGCGRRVSVR